MIRSVFIALTFLFARAVLSVEIPVIRIADTINPGTGSYVVESIERAESAGSPAIVVELDTPGGLLSTTRQIAQSMLNAKIPVVVFVSPRGAQAGSAGALITLAADVSAMAPGTNIGAAHPVAGGGEKIDPVMNDKMTNDTAAFAESLAKLHGRNTEWAIHAVRKSASAIAEEALKMGVIDLIAEDLPSLLISLKGRKLNVPKNKVSEMPNEVLTPLRWEPKIKHRLVSFFANPNLAYLIMTLGGLCIWVELSHPGLIFPGVLGVICILLSLVSFQLLPIDYGALAFLMSGFAMVIAELYVPAYGLLGIAGIVCFILGSLFLMDTNAPEFRISLSLIIPTAAVLASCAIGLGMLLFKSRNRKVQTGLEAMVGEFGEVREEVSKENGKIFIQGELWNAVTEKEETIKKGEIVRVLGVAHMVLVVTPRN